MDIMAGKNLTRFPRNWQNAGTICKRGWLKQRRTEAKDPSKLYSPEETGENGEAGTEPGYKSYDYYDMVMRKKCAAVSHQC